ncbi:MAG TPA: adenylate/guanylate cyclase domain-containing protein, partial [Candidatus Dormibacteraeota bacterium]
RDHPLQRQEQLEQGWVTLRHQLATGAVDDAARLASDLSADPWALAGTVLTDTVVEALLTAGRVDEAGHVVDSIAQHPRAAMHRGHLHRARGRLALARGDGAAEEQLREAGEAYAAGGYRLELMRTRAALGEALAGSGNRESARRTLDTGVSEARAVGAVLIARACEGAARRAGIDLEDVPAASGLTLAAASGASAPSPAGDIERLGTRAVTVLVADVRARSGDAPAPAGDPMEALRRWAALAVEQHHGVVDEFAGDVVMATFNAGGHHPDHARHALDAALELVRTSVRLDRAVAAGIATGLATIGRLRQTERITVVGDAPNLAARLHAEAAGGEIVMAESTFVAVGEELPAALGTPVPCTVGLAGLEAPAAALRLSILTGGGTQAGRGAPARRDEGGRIAREGEFWSLSYAGKVIRLKDAKGVRDLARLLANPGTEIAAVDLAGVAMPVSAGRGRTAAGLDLGVEGDAGEVLDAQARGEYKQRLIDLEAELAEAEESNDPERASRVRQERDFLIDELGAAVGLMGRSRRALDPAERARKAVTWRLRDTIGRIETAHPELGRHLQRSVRTGAFCVYDPATPTRWS